MRLQMLFDSHTLIAKIMPWCWAACEYWYYIYIYISVNLAPLWHWSRQACSMTKTQYKKAPGLVNKAAAAEQFSAPLISFFLIGLLCEEQTRSISHTAVRDLSYIGRHPQVLCVSQRDGWQLKVFAPWPVAACCWVSLRLVSGAERGPRRTLFPTDLWENSNSNNKQRQNKPVSFAYLSALEFENKPHPHHCPHFSHI